MKIYISLLYLLLCFVGNGKAQDTIRVEDASKHIGDSVTVYGKIYGGIFLDKSKNQPTFLNMGAAYPNHLLTIVIWKKERAYFKKPPEIVFKNKDVYITGRIIEFNGKPEIIFEKPEQLQIK